MLNTRQILDIFKHRGAPATAHTWSTKWVHWAAAALLAYAGFINGKVTDALYSPGAMQVATLAGVGLTLLYGYLWLWVRGPGGGSRLPADAPNWERRLAYLVHAALYLGIAAAVLSGFAMAYLAPSDVVVFAPARQILQMSRRFAAIRDFHEASAQFVGLTFLLHLSGALWHKIVRRDGVMQSISVLPGNG